MLIMKKISKVVEVEIQTNELSQEETSSLSKMLGSMTEDDMMKFSVNEEEARTLVQLFYQLVTV